MPIITSRLDTDFYKFTMMHAIMATCVRLGIDMPIASYRFKCRNNPRVDLLHIMEKLKKEVNHFKGVLLTGDEIRYLSDHIHPSLAKSLYQTNLNNCQVSIFERDQELNIEVEGPWCEAIEFEVPVLAMVNELYFKDIYRLKRDWVTKTANANLAIFLKDMDQLGFVDFGTRRRFSKAWHQKCLRKAVFGRHISGTSNVYFAKHFGLKPIGTMAHEWLMGFQALSRRLIDFQKEAFEHWMLTYRGAFLSALTDVLGIDQFLKDWDMLLMKNYRTLRHDSGDPEIFMAKLGIHYRGNEEKPRLLFSDGLTPTKFKSILDYARTHYSSFPITPPGIGTFFTNNCGPEPLQIVMKLHKLNGRHVIKMSDTPGKAMGDEQAAKRIINTFNIK